MLSATVHKYIVNIYLEYKWVMQACSPLIVPRTIEVHLQGKDNSLQADRLS